MRTLKVALLGIIVGLWLPLSAQNDRVSQKDEKIPEHVHTKFSHDYPQTADTEWKMDGDSYVVEFTTAEKGNQRVWYDKSGKKQAEEHLVDAEKDVPVAVRDAINNRYDNYYVVSVSKMTKGENTTYRAKLKRNGVESEIILDSEGENVKE